MNMVPGLTKIIFLLLLALATQAQDAGTLNNELQRIPGKYFDGLEKKAKQYIRNIDCKTENTLVKLSRWENKIRAILKRVNPEATSLLFSEGRPTFTTVLQEIRNGASFAGQYPAGYNKYLDDVTTRLKYLAGQDSNLTKKATTLVNDLDVLAAGEVKAEAIQQFIETRRKELVEQALRSVGKNRYLSKIDKETYYYSASLKNYREIFSDPTKTEEIIAALLGKIPAFKKFAKQHSLLSGLFDISPQNGRLDPGLQTRVGVEQLIKGRLAETVGQASGAMNKNLQSAQAQLINIKSRLKEGGTNSELPGFKPNDQKTKTFGQRIEYTASIRFAKSQHWLPQGTDIAFGVGYRLNDRSLVGFGASYLLGIGNIGNIHLSTQGLGIRTYADWKLKKQFFITGGLEINYLTMKSLHQQLPATRGFYPSGIWQKAALIGIMKKMNIRTGWFTSTNVQVLCDLFSRRHVLVSQPVLFRMGYNF
ncbi:MAG: hypothetical protein ABIQ31_10210 [Ferruginibacter sp.]